MLKNTFKCINIAFTIMLIIGLYSCKGPENIDNPLKTELIFELPDLSVDYPGGKYSLSYVIVNPTGNEIPTPKCDAEWIHDISMDEHKIYLEIDPNESTEERTATIDITYGKIQTFLNVKQKTYIAPFTLKVPDETVTETTAKIYAYPEDSEMTYIITSIEKSQKEYLGGDDIVFSSILGQYKEEAKFMNITLAEYLKLNNLLLKGDCNVTISRHEPETEYYALAVGMTEDGKKTSAIIYEKYITKQATDVEQTFDITINVNGLNASVQIETTDNDNYYLFNCLPKEYIDEKGLSLREYIDEIMADNIEYGILWGLSPEDVVKSICSIGTNSKDFENLDGETEYLVYAGGVSLSGKCNSEVASKTFETGPVPPSSNTITITMNEIGVDNATIDIKTTNDDPYAVIVEIADKYAGKSDSEILSEVIKYNLSSNIYNGDYNGTVENLNSDTDYMVLAFGYLGGKANTQLYKKTFRTLYPGDPKEFKFHSETSDITITNAKVSVSGEPSTILYYWDIAPSAMSDDEIITTINTEIQKLIDAGTVSSRMEYLKKVGTRGDDEFIYDNLYSNTEYVPFALAINEKTGENVGGVFRGTPFITKEKKVSDITLNVSFDKYWDADEIAENFGGYDEFFGQGLYCMPFTLETSETVRTSSLVAFFGDYTDTNKYSDDYMIEQLFADPNTAIMTQYFLPYNEDCTIAAVALDFDGNFTNVFRVLINRSKDGVSDIRDFEPLNAPHNIKFKYSSEVFRKTAKNEDILKSKSEIQELPVINTLLQPVEQEELAITKYLNNMSKQHRF